LLLISFIHTSGTNQQQDARFTEALLPGPDTPVCYIALAALACVCVDPLVCHPRDSKDVAAETQLVHINKDAISKLDLDPAVIKAASQSQVFPVKFDSMTNEITFITLLHLLDFGSGFDSLLMEKNKRQSQEIVQFAVLGMHISGVKLTHHWMKAFDM
jgi:hypothetical protein